MTTTPSKMPPSRVLMTATVDQMRHGWSRMCGSDGACSSDMVIAPCVRSPKAMARSELGNGKTIGQHHQHQHQNIPEAESVERCRYPLRGMNGECVKRPGDHQHRSA